MRLKYIVPSTGSRSYWTLKLRDPYYDNLLLWNIGGQEAKLKSRERHLMVHAPTGKLSWPAMNKTQISQFGNSLEISEGILDIPGLREKSFIDFVWDEDEIERCNIIIRATVPHIGLDLGFGVYFDIGEVKIVGDIQDNSTQHWKNTRYRKYVEELLEKPVIFEQRICWLLFNFERYASNSFGASPSYFLRGSDSKRFWIALRGFEYANRPTLVLSENINDLL